MMLVYSDAHTKIGKTGSKCVISTSKMPVQGDDQRSGKDRIRALT